MRETDSGQRYRRIQCLIEPSGGLFMPDHDCSISSPYEAVEVSVGMRKVEGSVGFFRSVRYFALLQFFRIKSIAWYMEVIKKTWYMRVIAADSVFKASKEVKGSV